MSEAAQASAGGSGAVRASFRVAVVTGAARGIGLSIARALASRGMGVALLDKDGPGLQRAAGEVSREARPSRPESETPGEPAGTLAFELDLTDFEAVPAVVREIVERWGRIDVLVNNAGWDEIHPFLETDASFWDRVLRINLLSVMATCKAVAPVMVEAGYGRIVNISSDAGRVGSTGEVPYSGAKAGVIGFSKGLARELAPHGITVNVVCPGPTDTPLLDEMSRKSEEGAKVLRAIGRAIPMGRLARPEDIAHAVGFFASEEAGYVTGQVLSVSGGLTMVG